MTAEPPDLAAIRARVEVREVGACSHPADSITWDFKEPGGRVVIIDGLLYGTCDDCGAEVTTPMSVPPAGRPDYRTEATR